jgi:GntR family transcriptional repressor for pyruvate dehydrogenase complex
MTAAARVAERLEALIRRERISPGGRLPTELVLARRFGVSRAVVREALQTLKTLGVVESRPRTGLRVLPFEPERALDRLIPRLRTGEERRELYELRCLLEPAILRLAARRASPGDLDRLEALLAAPPGGVREGIRRDVRFHEELWRLSGNRFVMSLKGLLLRYFADLERARSRRVSPAALRRAHGQHRAIVRALKDGDVGRAVRQLERNLATFRPGEEDPA